MEFGSHIKFDGIIPEGSVEVQKTMCGLINWNEFIGIGIEENNVRAYAELTREDAARMYEWLGAFLMGSKN